MISFSVNGWSAWAPGLAGSDEWLKWARAPEVPALSGAPELKFIAAMTRRRFSRLSKMALQVAFDAAPPELLADVPTVFASRHGEANACVALLSDIARNMPLSPTAFSHSVHNTQGGLFSIAANNGRTSSAIAAMEHTFCAGLIEALAISERENSRPTLLVVADEPAPGMIRGATDELECPFALALLVEPTAGRAAPGIRMEFAPGAAPVPASHGAAPQLPQALQFLAWMLAGRGALEFPHGAMSWRFQRDPA